MKNRRFYVFGIILSIVLSIGSMFLPESVGDTRALIFGIGVVCFFVFLIALIVSSIRAKRQAKAATTAPSTTPSAPTQPAAPTPTPSAPAPAPSAPAPATEAKKSTTVERVHVRGVDHNTKNVESVGFENPDYNLSKRELQEDFEGERVYQYTFDVKADLVPEPDNEYDPNAIMVQANGLCIGHVPKGSTAHIRKLMESGRIKSMKLNIGGGKYKEVYEVDDGEYELDKDALKYSAVLELYLTEEKTDSSEVSQ